MRRTRIQVIQKERPVVRRKITLNHGLTRIVEVVIDPTRDGAKLDALVRVDIVYLSVLTKDGHVTIG